METKQAYYTIKIKEHLSLKQKENPQYSLRAFARDLELHHGTLGKVIKGIRPLPYKDAEKVTQKLRLSPKERTLFMESLLRRKLSLDSIKIDDLDERFMVDESYYKFLAEWEHAAVIELFHVKGFEPTSKEISKRLKVSENRAEVVVQNLLTCGLVLLNEENKLALAHPDIRTTEDIVNQAIRESHIETMKMGITKINEIEVMLRDFSSTTVAIDLKKIPEAKTIIREFRQKMTALLRDSEDKTDVFQLAIQFYPLTEVETNKKQENLQ